MKLRVRRDREDVWGFVETFQTYYYNDKGTITALVAISPEGKMVSPYVYRGEMFIPAEIIQEEMGVAKYIRAKKPFYSRLCDGFVAEVKAGIDYTTGELLVDNTTYRVFTISDIAAITDTQGSIELRRIHELSDEVNNLMLKIAGDIVKCKGDREKFILSRL